MLCGQLVYTANLEKATSFKIRDLVKEDGCIDLSNKKIFGDTADHVLITTDSASFFRYDETSIKLHILFASKSLIKEIIETTAANIELEMEKWNEDHIGIFYRMECWRDLKWFDFLTHKNLEEISKENLYDNWYCTATRTRNGHFYISSKGTAACVMKNFMFILT